MAFLTIYVIIFLVIFMKRILIATTNKDKYDAVSKLFRNTIFPSDLYEIVKLTDEMNVPDEKEHGDNIERARQKALNAFNHLRDYNFDFIVGLDDAMFVKGRIEPNIKEYLNKILFEHYLDDGEEYAFNRAYCIIDKTEKRYETTANIPYIYRSLTSEFKIEDHSYPLSKVSYPIGYDIPICDLDEEHEIDYYLQYVKDALMSLDIKDIDE